MCDCSEFCAVDNAPCSGKCREQTRVVERVKEFDRASKTMVERDRMCPALMTFKDLPPAQQRRLQGNKPKVTEESDEEEQIDTK